MWVLIGLAVTGALGLLAVVSPRWFKLIACQSSSWIDTSKVLAVFDKRVGVDRYVVQYSRLLGLAVTLSVATFALLLSQL